VQCQEGALESDTAADLALGGHAAAGHPAGHPRLQTERSAREDLIALKALWACPHPSIQNHAAPWGEEMEETMRRAFQGRYYIHIQRQDRGSMFLGFIVSCW
jgi:hypothetical protein